MKNKIWVIVPTYWGHRGEDGNPPTAQFDHPTYLDTSGTLERTLKSITELNGDFNLLLIVASTHLSLDRTIHDTVTKIAEKYADKVPLYLVSNINLSLLNTAFGAELLSLDSYGNIRNVQLALPYVAGAETVVAIDDDEIIPNRDFLRYPQKYIGSECEGDTVNGMAGPYFCKIGSHRINSADKLAGEDNIFLKKNYYMDQAVCRGMTVKGIGVCNVAFGGNMVFSRELIENVCHDPYIPRGEDYDYVINAKSEGYNFYICPEMSITHLPPDSTGSQAADNMFKLVNDISRFIYQKAKFEALPPEKAFDKEYLQPYPGVFLDPEINLAEEGKKALRKKYNLSPDEVEEIIQPILNNTDTAVNKYFQYTEKWQSTIKLHSKINVEEFRVTPAL